MLHARFCFSYIPFDCTACANFSVSAVTPALQEKKEKKPSYSHADCTHCPSPGNETVAVGFQGEWGDL